MRIRLQFTKLGRAAFGSHLDLVRLLPRLFRRLGLPLYYSQGFHPKPVISFGPALSLGVSSLAEYVDVKLEQQPLDLSALPARLSAGSVDGVRFVAARILEPTDAKLNTLIDAASYVAGLPRSSLEQLGLCGPDALAAHVSERRRGPLCVERNVDGRVKRIEVDRYLSSAAVDPAGAGVLEQAGFVGSLTPLTLTLSITAAGSAKASEAVTALLGQPVEARLVRAALGSHHGGRLSSPLALEVHRERSRRAAQVAGVQA